MIYVMIIIVGMPYLNDLFNVLCLKTLEPSMIPIDPPRQAVKC